MTATVLAGLAACGGGALAGWALVRWTNIAIARLWAIALLLLTLGLVGVGLMRGTEGGGTLVVVGGLIVLPGLIGSVVAMVLTEWRMAAR
jgi:hypothetical protein